MTIHQLSIFLENKSNSLVNVLRLFKKLEIQLIASTISDTADNGIYRVICSEPLRAYKGLKEAGVTVALSDVFAIELDDIPGIGPKTRDGLLNGLKSVKKIREANLETLSDLVGPSKAQIVYDYFHPQDEP